MPFITTMCVNTKITDYVICDWLHRTPIQGSVPDSSSDDETVSNFVDSFILNHNSLSPDSNSEAQQFLKPDGEVHRGRSGLLFIESYRELPLLAWTELLFWCGPTYPPSGCQIGWNLEGAKLSPESLLLTNRY